MSQIVRLSDELCAQARRAAELFSRTVPKQIEYWSRIGKLAEENPDLPLSFLREVQAARRDAAAGDLADYEFD